VGCFEWRFQRIRVVYFPDTCTPFPPLFLSSFVENAAPTRILSCLFCSVPIEYSTPHTLTDPSGVALPPPPGCPACLIAAAAWWCCARCLSSTHYFQRRRIVNHRPFRSGPSNSPGSRVCRHSGRR